jgi:hypothetical protein
MTSSTKAQKIPKRVTTALIQSLGAGVTPRVGLGHIAVGRKAEIEALVQDLDNVIKEGGATCRLVVGRYGSGKSFLCQLVRNYALDRNFVVIDAELSPTHRLTGSGGQGLNLYRELMKNCATRTQESGAFKLLLEQWISTVKQGVQSKGLKPNSPKFNDAVEASITDAVKQIEGLVHGFEFGSVISAYWQGHQNGDDAQKDAALRWLRGEYDTKTEARKALNVGVIIDDDSWYDYLKLLAQFVKTIGYAGLVIFIDEAVNLYKISNTTARSNNYERLLTIFNDTMQGKVGYLGIYIGATPDMVEDTRRGLFSYDALRTRLQESRFAQAGLRDLSGPLVRLDVLTPNEMAALLAQIRRVHALHFGYTETISDDQLFYFLNEVRKRLGAEKLLTPRELVRDFIYVLNLLQQNPDATFEGIVGGSGFVPTRPGEDPEALTPATEITDEAAPQSPYKNFDL